VRHESHLVGRALDRRLLEPDAAGVAPRRVVGVLTVLGALVAIRIAVGEAKRGHDAALGREHLVHVGEKLLELVVRRVGQDRMREDEVELDSEAAGVEVVPAQKPRLRLIDERLDVVNFHRLFAHPFVGIDAGEVTVLEEAHEVATRVQEATPHFEDVGRRLESLPFEQPELDAPTVRIGAHVGAGVFEGLHAEEAPQPRSRLTREFGQSAHVRWLQRGV